MGLVDIKAVNVNVFSLLLNGSFVLTLITIAKLFLRARCRRFGGPFCAACSVVDNKMSKSDAE